MIGQKQLISVIDNQIELDEFPKFSIIVGPEGSGKKTLSYQIANKLGCQRTFIEPKIDAIREMINSAYTVQTKTLYVILDGNMSIPAENALLKICEETPLNTYIMWLVSDSSIILDTLKSRAGIYYIQPYTTTEILEYAQIGREVVDDSDIIADLCETPGDVDRLRAMGMDKFYSFVEKVVNNIANVSSANALKITNNIDTKGTDADKYDMILFLRAFRAICGRELRIAIANNDLEGQMWFSDGIKVTTNILNQTRINGINKSALLDMFILDIRREWV